MDPDPAAKPPWSPNVDSLRNTTRALVSACGRPRGVLYRASPKIDPLLRARALYRRQRDVRVKRHADLESDP